MPTNPSALRKQQAVKLSVTVKSNLENKYDLAALKRINAAIKRWIAADLKRGIQTVHVAVDDPADTYLKKLRVKRVSGKATAPKIKRAVDDLWKKLNPEYLVLFGGASGAVPPFDLIKLSQKGSLFITRPTLAHYTLTREELEWRASDVLGSIARGELKLRIHKVYPLAEAAHAHRDLEGRKTTGKLLLKP